MPYLVARTEDGKKGGIWEVKWTWMPYFLAADRELHKEVDQEMNKLFQNGEGADLMAKAMSGTVIKIIAKRYRMPGLEEALRALELVDPEVKIPLEVLSNDSEPVSPSSSESPAQLGVV